MRHAKKQENATYVHEKYKNQVSETTCERAKTLDLAYQDIRAGIINMLKEIKETILKEIKVLWECQTQNINNENS